MKKKANIYDADDVERSKRLNFTPEERAARAEHKAEVLGTKLEKAKKKVPKKKKLRLQKELDPEKSKLKHTLRFEEVEKKRGQEALPKKAGRRMVQSASATVHSKIHQVEEENVGTKAAHRTELASEGAAALASHEIRKYRQNAPYKRVEKLEAQVNRANVSAAYRAAVRDNPELQENTVKRLIQKQRIKHQYAKEFRKAKPVVLALNMMDIVEKRGMEIDTHRLPEMLGIPVIPVSARKRTGLDVLLHAAAHHKDCKDPECLIHHHKYKPKHRHDHHSEYAMVYSDAIEDKPAPCPCCCACMIQNDTCEDAPFLDGILVRLDEAA